MTKLLERAVTTARNLSPVLQDEIARMILAYAGEEEGLYEFSPEEAAELDEAEAAARRGDFRTDAEVQAIWAR